MGTHALFQKDVSLLARADHHRRTTFGVHQRMALRSKGGLPHQLIMTATPIPRTLTMVLYADMNVSVIDELPPGRQTIDTSVVSDARRTEVIARIAEFAATPTGVLVCTLIEESDASISCGRDKSGGTRCSTAAVGNCTAAWTPSGATKRASR